MYSYYTEKTDLNESMMGMSDANASPDKNARLAREVNAPNVMVDLDTNPSKQGSASKERPAPFILDSQDVAERRETPPFESVHSQDTPRGDINMTNGTVSEMTKTI